MVSKQIEKLKNLMKPSQNLPQRFTTKEAKEIWACSDATARSRLKTLAINGFVKVFMAGNTFTWERVADKLPFDA